MTGMTTAELLERMGFYVEEQAEKFVIVSHRQADNFCAIEDTPGKAIVAVRWLSAELGKDHEEVKKARAILLHAVMGDEG